MDHRTTHNCWSEGFLYPMIKRPILAQERRKARQERRKARIANRYYGEFSSELSGNNVARHPRMGRSRGFPLGADLGQRRHGHHERFFWDFIDNDESNVGEGVEGVTIWLSFNKVVSIRESCEDEFTDSDPDAIIRSKPPSRPRHAWNRKKRTPRDVLASKKNKQSSWMRRLSRNESKPKVNKVGDGQ